MFRYTDNVRDIHRVEQITFLSAHFIAAYVMDSIGRKYCIIGTSILKTFACLLQTFADEVWMLLVARSALGALDAVVFCCVPAYASEVADVRVLHRSVLDHSLSSIKSIKKCII